MRFSCSTGLAVLLVCSSVAGCGGGVLPTTGDGGLDAGTHDAGSTPDAGAVGMDGGAPTDAGAGDDGSTGDDAGSGDDAGAPIDAGAGDDAGTAVDAGSPVDAGHDAGGRDAGSMCTGGTPPMGCCFLDSDCDPGQLCYGASCSPFFSSAGRCLVPPTDGTHCWNDGDCSGTMDRCMGARVCGCGGIFCGPDALGTCGMGFPFP